MRLGELLVGWGLATPADVATALERQAVQGGRLGEILVAVGILTQEQLASVINATPTAPTDVADTGILPRNLLNLMLKLMYVESLGTLVELSQRMKLPRRIIEALLADATQQRFVMAMGQAGENALSMRYALGEQGKAAARE